MLDRLQPGELLHTLTCRGLALTHRRLGRTCGVEAAPAPGPPDGPDAIVSTHPFASQALGQLRGSGALETPVISGGTDEADAMTAATH